MAIDFHTESNVEHLRKVAAVQQNQLSHAMRIIQEQSALLDKLRGAPGELQRRFAELEAEGSPTSVTGPESESTSATEKKKRRGHGPTEQPDLLRETVDVELDAADQVCPQCGGDLEAWAGQYESSEVIDVVSVQYKVVEVRRQKYRCSCGCVDTALPGGPDRAIAGGRYSLAFAIAVCTAKYLDHIPLERQVRAMSRKGLSVTSSALWDQCWAISQLLEPTWEALLARVLEQDVIGLDQTGWPNLGRKSAKKWQMWCLTTPDVVFHTIRDDKSTATFLDLVGRDFSGIIVCDALSTHGAAIRDIDGARLAGCWAHIRRKFAEAEPDFPQARSMLDRIRTLYDIEARARSPAERAELRTSESTQVLEKMQTWMAKVRAPSSTALGAAVKHTLAYWDRLTRFVDDPHIWLDNNRTERGIRGPVVGRRNHFGSKSRRGTEAAAILYSLVETAKLHEVEPEAYLLEVCRRAQRGSDELLMPWDYATK